MMLPIKRAQRSVSTLELYNEWSQTYDTDENILQKIDSREFQTLVMEIFSDLSSTSSPPELQENVVVDYGCGTCRNTRTLLLLCSNHLPISSVHALEPSPSMLAIGKDRIESLLLSQLPSLAQSSAGADADADATATLPLPKITFHQLPQPTSQEESHLSKLPLPVPSRTATILISTLVLEHLEIHSFFELCSRAIAPNGYLLLSNMHSEMGARSQAGFLKKHSSEGGSGDAKAVGEERDEKVTGVSFVYSPDDVVGVAREWGFEILNGGRVRERGVEVGDVDGLGKRAEKWIGCKVWFGAVFKRVDGF